MQGVSYKIKESREAHQAPVVQTMDSATRRINHYPLDNSIGFASVYLVDNAIHRLNNWGQKVIVDETITGLTEALLSSNEKMFLNM